MAHMTDIPLPKDRSERSAEVERRADLVINARPTTAELLKKLIDSVPLDLGDEAFTDRSSLDPVPSQWAESDRPAILGALENWEDPSNKQVADVLLKNGNLKTQWSLGELAKALRGQDEDTRLSAALAFMGAVGEIVAIRSPILEQDNGLSPNMSRDAWIRQILENTGSREKNAARGEALEVEEVVEQRIMQAFNLQQE
ncbi:MAG: hypothetical protein K1X79_11360 [Oligoflexia bacterium]|nr:hypothetical protein [Oligoflexia bacterium]